MALHGGPHPELGVCLCLVEALKVHLELHCTLPHPVMLSEVSLSLDLSHHTTFPLREE